MFVCFRRPFCNSSILQMCTGGFHGYFYYVNLAGKSNNCQIEGLQEI